MKDHKNLIKLLNRCDVVAYNDNYQYIGFYYNKNSMPAPRAICKSTTGDGLSNVFCAIMFAGKFEIPTITDDAVTDSLLKNVDVGNYIPEQYYDLFAKIYAEKAKKQMPTSNFQEPIYKELNRKIDSKAKKLFINAETQWIGRITPKTKSKHIDVIKYFQNEINLFAKNHDLENYDCDHRNVLSNFFRYNLRAEEKNNIPIVHCHIRFWLQVYVCPSEQKIIVFTSNLLKSFEFSEVELALEYFKSLAKTLATEIKKMSFTSCDELNKKIKLRSIVKNSIEALLEANRKNTKTEYQILYDNNFMNICLKNKVGSSKTHHKAITYKEFMRNPKKFKNFIASPEKKD